MKKLLSAIFVILFSLTVAAQSGTPAFRHLTVADGLSSNHVRALMQDSFGFIWVGTDQDLCRYDGRDFKSISFPEEWTGVTVLTLLEDGDFIWVGTDRGVFRYIYAEEKLVRFDAVTAESMGVAAEVNNIRKDKDGNIWFSTMGQGVFRYSVETALLERFDFPFCSNNIANVYVDRSNQVWVATNWGTPLLSRLNKATDTFEELLLHDDGTFVQRGGLVLFEDSRQRFWMGSWDNGLYEIDRSTGHVDIHLHPSDTPRGLNHIHFIIESHPGHLAISSDDGILVYKSDEKEALFVGEGAMPGMGLSNRFVYPLLKDKEGGLWAGTYYGGLNYRSPFVGQFDEYVYSRYNDNTVGGKVISRFCEDQDHNIWIASDDGGLSRFDPKTGRFRNWSSSGSGLSYDNIHALCIDGKDLWIGTYTGGVNVLDTETGRFRVYMPEDGDETTIDGTSSYAIMKDRDGHIWVATMGGINLYDRRKDSFKRMYRTSSHVIIDMDQDPSGNIWFSSQGGGIIKFDSKKEKWKTYRHSSKEGSLPSDYVNCGFVDSQGNVWFGTSFGLCCYDPDTDRFRTMDLDKSLSNIFGIAEDQKVLWITTSKGLLRYDPKGDIQVFSTGNGLRSSQFMPNAIFKASDGRIYLGTTNGFNTFYPYNVRSNTAVPDIAIIGLTIDNKEVEPGSGLLKKSVTGGGRIELNHYHNALTIKYASLSYCVPEKNQYSYMLEGFDREWNVVGNQTQATYTNLPAGTYSFKVKGTNNDALWNEEPAVLEIVVHPHPLLSTPFKVLYGVLVLVIIALMILLVVRFNDRKHEKKMEEFEDMKEKEVYEAKIKFFTMIAHEIRTPVSLIIGPLENMLKKAPQLPDKVKSDLQTMDRNSQRLLYLVNQLLDFRKVEQDSMVMRFTCRPVIPLLHSICERFEPTIVQNGARLEVEYPNEDFIVCVDGEAITKLVSNLLTNASKYTRDLVRLSCSICPDDETMFSITVYDNGCGISQQEQSKIFMPFYQTLENKPGTGIGLSLVKSIAELHGGSVSVESETGSYSAFTVRLPMSHNVEAELAEVQNKDEKDPEERLMEDILSTDIVELQPELKPLVMIVDDNEDIVKFLAETLEDKYEILTASDGKEALDLIETHPDVALVIADWMMPVMDGIELCREIRNKVQTSHISYILLTAKTDDASKVMGMDCGADAYIEKPFSVEYLEACIKNQVAMRTILRRRYSSLPLTPLTTVANNNADNRFLLMMTNLIEAHLSDSNLTVDFLTEQMGVSRSSFYNKIKSLTNSTPNELIQLMRLKKAAQLLTEGKYRINEICYMVGFSNPSYFSKCFAKQFGLKPGEFAAKSAEK